MFDIHCHLLPGLDDGSGYIDETIEMAELAVSGGTRGIICTPHDSPPDPYPPSDIFPLIDHVRLELEQRNIPLKLYTGQEIFLTDEALELLLQGELLTLNRTAYALVEFSPRETPTRAYSKLKRLVSAGLTPIVAHPERYGFIRNVEDAAAYIKEIGCFLQVNKGSLKGFFGSDVAHTAHHLLRTRLADFVASDAHSPYVRTTYLSDVREIICENYSEDYADHLLTSNPLRIITNQPIYSY